MMDWIQPKGWPRPSGYSNAVLPGGGRLLVLAGQVGWDEKERIVAGGFVAQFEQALRNVITLIEAAGGACEHLVHLRLFLTDKKAYLSSRKEIGQIWRTLMGRHYPCMTAVVVAGLVEEGAMIEIEGLAVLPETKVSG
jgi:enamine deaminase RidA (YjgF/YER057c/UK114 family)